MPDSPAIETFWNSDRKDEADREIKSALFLLKGVCLPHMFNSTDDELLDNLLDSIEAERINLLLNSR